MVSSAASFDLCRTNVVALILAVPTVAMIHGGKDDVDGKVTIAPADGPNGEYATVENGELRVDFEP